MIVATVAAAAAAAATASGYCADFYRKYEFNE